MSVFRLLHRADDDQRAVPRAVRRAAAAARELLTQRHMDLAASIQAVTEEIVLRLTRAHRGARPVSENLCLAGGVALNCVANGKVLRDGLFDATLDPAGGGRCGRRAGCRARGVSPVSSERAAHGRSGATACAARYLGPAFAQREIERRLSRPGEASTSLR